MAEFHSFSFTNVNFIFGTLEVTGWADGDDVLTLEYDTDQWNKLVGAKGDVVRSQTNDNSVTVTARILQESVTNSQLNVIFNTDRESNAGVFPGIIQDKETNETYTVNNLWIMKAPTITRGQATNQMEWVFQGDFCTQIIL